MLKPTADIDLIMMDSKGSTGAVTVHIPASSTIAIGDAVASALASLVAPMSDAVLIKYRISWRNGTDALSVAETGAAIKNAGVFVLCSDSSPQLAVLNIPGIKEENSMNVMIVFEVILQQKVKDGDPCALR